MVRHRVLFTLTFLQVIAHLCYANTANCYWTGSAPNCESSCQPNEYVAGVSSIHNGTQCASGSRKYCCLKRSEGNMAVQLTRRPISAIRLGTTTTNTPDLIDMTTPATELASPSSLPLAKFTRRPISVFKLGTITTSTPELIDTVVGTTASATPDLIDTTPTTEVAPPSSLPPAKFTRRPISAIKLGSATTSTPALVDTTNPTTVVASPTSRPTNITDLSSTGDCRWVGEGPNCNSTCRPGERVAAISSEDDGNNPCVIGSRKYCCRIVIRRKLTPKPSASEQAPTTQKPTEVIMEDKTNEASTASHLRPKSAEFIPTLHLNQTMLSTTTDAVPTSATNIPSTNNTLEKLNATNTNQVKTTIETTTENLATTVVTDPSPAPGIGTTAQPTFEKAQANFDVTDVETSTAEPIKMSPVPKIPKNRTTLPPLPIIPLIFRNFRALNSSSVITAQ